MTNSRDLDVTAAFMRGVELATSAHPAQQAAGLLALERVFDADSFFQDRAGEWLRAYKDSSEVDDVAQAFFRRLTEKYGTRR